MPSLFDNQRNVMYATVNGLFAVPASWTSVDTLASFTGSVLFNNPTIKEIVDGSGYIPETPYFEFNLPLIPGLKIRVDKNNSLEIITIDGVQYYVTSVELTRDGNNAKAYVKLVADDYGPQNQIL